MADPRLSDMPNRPLNIQALSEEAESFDFNIHIPLKHYVMAADTLFREASATFTLRGSP